MNLWTDSDSQIDSENKYNSARATTKQPAAWRSTRSTPQPETAKRHHQQRSPSSQTSPRITRRWPPRRHRRTRPMQSRRRRQPRRHTSSPWASLREMAICYRQDSTATGRQTPRSGSRTSSSILRLYGDPESAPWQRYGPAAQWTTCSAARKWLEGVPPGMDFSETVRRFRRSFGASDGSNTELLTKFRNRRQASDKPMPIEEMANRH